MRFKTMTKFIIFTTQRSGSTVLTKTLDEHPQVFAAGELFHTNERIHHPEWHFTFINYLGKGKARGVLMKMNKALNKLSIKKRITKHLESFFNAKDKNEKARGFKLMLSQVKTTPYILEQVKKHDVKIIVLLRKNIFETALSKYRGRTTKLYHSDDNVGKQKVQIPIEEFTSWLAMLDGFNQRLLQLTEEFDRIVIYYEDFSNWQQIMDETFAFLGVDQLQLAPVLQKVGSDDWREDVENYKELEQAVQQTNYAAWLN